MRRGELYRVYKGTSNDPKNYRVFVIVSRQNLIDSKFSTVICASIYSNHDGLFTQVRVGIEEGLKHESSIHCDELVSIQKTRLTDYIGILSEVKIKQLDKALKIALTLD
jgi:mRNA interferase MazF